MNEKREFATSVVLPNGTLFILGGEYGDNSLTTTEVLVDNDYFDYGIDLPEEFYKHCAVLVNSTHLIIAGGLSDAEAKNSTYLLDIDSGSWDRTDDLIAARYWHSCGLVGNDKVVAAGGYNGADYLASTEIFNLRTMEWSEGKCTRLTIKINYTVTFSLSLLLLLSFSLSLIKGEPERERREREGEEERSILTNQHLLNTAQHHVFF